MVLFDFDSSEGYLSSNLNKYNSLIGHSYNIPLNGKKNLYITFFLHTYFTAHIIHHKQ